MMSISSTGLYGSATIVYSDLFVCTYMLRPNSPTHTVYYVLTL